MNKQTEALTLALEALEWINRVNAMEYEYQQKARESLNAIYDALAEQETVLPGGGHVPAVPVAVYGYCPECGGAGVMRERRPNGDDKCTNGHKYPSSKALAEQPAQQWNAGVPSLYPEPEPGVSIKVEYEQPEFFTHNVEQPYDWSEWVCPDPKSYLMKCCDCGLVHEAQFKVVRYKSEDEREECDTVDDPNVQAVFRMRRSEQWSPKDMAYRPGGLPLAEQPAQDNTYNYAKSLAKAIFKQHFASDEHYASGRIVWGVNDTVIGILTQINNMVADMVRRPAQQQKPVAYDKTELNCFAQDLYDQKMREGKRGHYESMFHVIHQCIKKVSPPASKPWVGLTKKEENELWEGTDSDWELMKRTEAKLKEKNA